jgi:hypothetical protein
MASDSKLSDDEIRAAARRWLGVHGKSYVSAVDDFLPGELSRERDGLAERLRQWTPERLADDELPPGFAKTQSRIEAEQKLELAGFEPLVETKRPYGGAD